ncbi:MAG: iron-containing alcohol dehydrogenase [Rickettsiales bacterium]|nr:iron-containing alcohol dehydrogenase [Rickettsiales bacterium]
MTHIVLERSLKGKEKSLLHHACPSGRLAVVCDLHTREALGQRILSQLSGDDYVEIILPSPLLACMSVVTMLRQRADGCSAYVAIGSGTMNDLCKYAAFLDKKPYVVFATAPSMNGYLSPSASLMMDTPHTPHSHAHKESVQAQPPTHLFADLEVLAAAPMRLIQSGLGDSLCRATAQTDWHMSHLLLNTPYDARPFEQLAHYEERVFADAEKLLSRDVDTVECLMKMLLISGEGMQLAGGSYPASQGEHMIAHAYELLAHSSGYEASHVHAQPYHGELIAVTTLEMGRLQQDFLTLAELPPSTPSPYNTDIMHDVFGASSIAFANAYHQKMELFFKHANQVTQRWSDARKILLPHIISSERLHEILDAAGMAATPDDLGLHVEHFHTARNLAAFTRERFTFLDVEKNYPLPR